MGFKIENGILKRYTGKENAIVVPDNVETIGSLAFYGCTSLISITIPDSVKSIKYWAFRDCTNLTSVTIPNSVKSIEVGAFMGCTSLASVTIGNNVTSVRDYAFCDCESLTSVTIPDSVTSIGFGAFSFCLSLTSVTIPDGVTDIRWRAFEGCKRLTSIVIPDSVTNIGNCAFFNCTKLKSEYANYKAFIIYKDDIKCRDYIFKPNEWTEEITEIELCEKGYHFCTNLFEIFNYYSGRIDKDIAIYECEIGEKIIHDDKNSKSVTNRIKPVKRLYQKDIIKILNRE